MKAAFISMLIIFAVWAGIIFWAGRELNRVLTMTP